MARSQRKRGRGRFQDLTGRAFGRLTVIKQMPSVKAKSMWLCRCECGEERIVRGTHLTWVRIRSCGCLKREQSREVMKNRAKLRERPHNYIDGRGDTPEYGIWHQMMRRCYDKNHVGWEHYGGRGIRVCQLLQDFQNFIIDLGSRPSDEHSLGRINNERGYNCGWCKDCKSFSRQRNVQWETRKQQARNTTRNVLIERKGCILTIAGWAEILGMKYATLCFRLRRGWSIDRAFDTPIRERR
jgi:hypothetical protein